MKLSAVLITFNEAKNIKECLNDLLFCDEIIVVDSGSTDKTAEIASQHGAKVFQHDFCDFASQKNFAIDLTSGEWVLLIDADERVDERLRTEIVSSVQDSEAQGFFLLRKNRIFNRWIKFGGNQEDLQLRLIRKERARFEGKVHERIFWKGPKITLKNPLLHYSTTTITEYIKKLILYTGIEVEILNSRSAMISDRGLKWRPVAVFFDRFILKRGFLDGSEGFLFCFLSAYYEFIRQARSMESRR